MNIFIIQIELIEISLRIQKIYNPKTFLNFIVGVNTIHSSSP